MAESALAPMSVCNGGNFEVGLGVTRGPTVLVRVLESRSSSAGGFVNASCRFSFSGGLFYLPKRAFKAGIIIPLLQVREPQIRGFAAYLLADLGKERDLLVSTSLLCGLGYGGGCRLGSRAGWVGDKLRATGRTQ